VEWLEVFFVSYYFTALMFYVNHGDSLFSPGYSVWTLIAAPVVSGAIAFSGLKPHQLQRHAKAPVPAAAVPIDTPAATPAPPEGQPWGFLIWLVAAFVLWLAVGFKLFPAETAGHPAQAAAAATEQIAAPAGH
jgi:hypothetical protein